MDSAEAIIAGTLGVFVVLCLVVYVLQVIGYWKIFKKFGEPGWKSIIPLFNYYIEVKYVWGAKWFWIIIGVACLGGVISGFGDEGSTVEFIGNGVSAVASIITLVETFKLSKSFGHGWGWFIGLVFLKSIFTIMLGFGKSQYIGKTGEDVPGLNYVYPKSEEDNE